MKIHKSPSNIFRHLVAILMIAAAISYPALMSAHNVEKYASSSLLSAGKWGKVKVSRTGMQFVSAATLRKLGFNDPTKVNVYGFGGRVLEDLLKEKDPDDLPILPSVKSTAGIWFFGHDHIRWNPLTREGVTNMAFSHSMQPYAEESWYFLSDRETPAFEMQPAPDGGRTDREITTFIQRLLHENDMIHPYDSGFFYLGEDLRSAAGVKIPFTLTDKATDDISLRLKVGVKGLTSLKMTLSLTDGDATSSHVVAFDNTSNQNNQSADLRAYTASANVKISSERLTISPSVNAASELALSRLDFIELSYDRRITMRDGQIYFNVAPSSGAGNVHVAGGSSNMRIWDVTDPVNPKDVSFTMNGTNATFITPGDYREYVAFIPEQGGYETTMPVQIANQDLHSLPTPDMLIISPTEYMTASNRMAQHHRDHDGFIVHVISPEEIYNEFSSGTPDVGAFRRLLKMWYDRSQNPDPSDERPRGRIRYCLIMSRPTYDNKLLMDPVRNCGYPRIPMWQSPVTYLAESSFGTDDYIGLLEDGEHRTFSMTYEKINVAVGRMPVTSPTMASEVVEKYIKYVTEPEFGRWRHQMLLIADNNEQYHLKQSENFNDNFLTLPGAEAYEIEKLYIDTYPLEQGSIGFTTPAAKSRMLKIWNDGVNFISYIGHGSPVGLTHEDLLNWTDINNFSNPRLPFLYAATCEFARFDQDTPSGAEILWSNPNGGIIATLCPSRKVYIIPNGDYSAAVGKELIDKNDPFTGRRIGDVMIASKNDLMSYKSDDANRNRFAIIGNPAMRLATPSHRVVATSIAGKEFSEDAEAPVLEARSKVDISGVILSGEGVKDTDFNGELEIVLYDAEKAYETLGQLEQGTILHFNDCKNIIYRGRAKVKGGDWNTTLLLPSEIEDLYNRAKLAMYAYAEGGTEAHGGTRNLYVYGFDSNAPVDNDGPEIEYFALNRKDYQEGALVNSSPVVMARMSDESGINISDAGIGHQISLILDGRTTFNDVNSYYTPDPDDYTAGSILYPLPDLEAGEHTLKLTVWDNANNSATSEIKFNVGAAKRPEIYELYTDVNPARTDVNFTLSTDRPMSQVDCMIEVFDLSGRKVWTSARTATTDIRAGLKVHWDLCDGSGVRVPRGIYLYRATITAPDGTFATSSRKLAVTAR